MPCGARPDAQLSRRSATAARGKGAWPAPGSCDVVTQCRFTRHMLALPISEPDAERIGSQEELNAEHLLI